MKIFKRILVTAMVTFVLASNASFVGAIDVSDPSLQPDLSQGGMGEMISTPDGQKLVYINGELQTTRASARDVYYANGFYFNHDHAWTSSAAGKGAEAWTLSYAEDNPEVAHYHYTRVTIRDMILPIIDEDSGEVWGYGYTHARTDEKPQYYDELQYRIRSYWGDEYTG